MYQPYQMGYQPYPQMYQPQQYQPMQQVQQPVQQPVQQVVGLTGRIVNNESEITIDDVPMNGATAYFPLANGSAIVGKRWTDDGSKIEPLIYVLQQQEKQPDPMEVMSNKLDQILEAVTAKPAKHATKEADNA